MSLVQGLYLYEHLFILGRTERGKGGQGLRLLVAAPAPAALNHSGIWWDHRRRSSFIWLFNELAASCTSVFTSWDSGEKGSRLREVPSTRQWRAMQKDLSRAQEREKQLNFKVHTQWREKALKLPLLGGPLPLPVPRTLFENLISTMDPPLKIVRVSGAHTRTYTYAHTLIFSSYDFGGSWVPWESLPSESEPLP